VAKYGKRILCENHGRFYMREIIRPRAPTVYVDDALTRVFEPGHIIAQGWALPEPINPVTQ
jgi:hypothetical protein